jgi:predicted nucleic acid-binding protein
VPALVDTNVLVYRFDPRFPRKQRAAEDLLRRGLAADDLRLPHQAVVEFFAAVTRPTRSGSPLLPREEALRETRELLDLFTILYPTEEVVRTAIQGAASYQLSWFDAHLWAFAEVYGLSPLISEDFENSRLYGKVRALNPFKDIREEI